MKRPRVSLAGFLVIALVACRQTGSYYLDREAGTPLEVSFDTPRQITFESTRVVDVAEVKRESHLPLGESVPKDGSYDGAGYSTGHSVVAVVGRNSLQHALPWCIIGLPKDGAGSIWFVQEGGVDPQSHTPAREFGEYAHYGATFAPFADIDGDGVEEILVSALGNLFVPGKVFVLSVARREILHAIECEEKGALFGMPACQVPDQDGDGIPDVAAVVARLDPPDRSLPIMSVHFYSTRTGLPARAPLDLDLEADHIPTMTWIPSEGEGKEGHLLIGVPYRKPRTLCALSVSTGECQWELKTEYFWDKSMHSQSVVSDMDGDETADVLSGALVDTGAGQNQVVVHLISGSTGEVLRTTLGMAGGLKDVAAVAPCGDRDGDGIQDFFFTAQPNSGRGVVYVASGRTGEGLQVYNLGDGSEDYGDVGYSISVGADWDGNGERDFCVTSYDRHSLSGASRAVRLVSSETGKILHYITADTMDELVWLRDCAPHENT